MKRLVLPLPPSVNHSHVNVRHGRRLMRIRSEATKRFMAEAGWLARKWAMESGWKVPEAGKKVILRMWMFWPDKRRRDQDNAIKLIQDALNGILWDDDRQVLPRVMDFSVDRENPRVEIEVEVVGGEGGKEKSAVDG